MNVIATEHPIGWNRTSWLLRLALGAVCLLLVAWTAHLWPHWLSNPDLSHGLLTPFLFALLVHEARTRGRTRYLQWNVLTVLALGFALISGILLLALGGLYAAAVGWTHALVNFLLALSMCAFLCAVWLRLAASDAKLVPFNWPAAAAILLWVLSAPIPPGTYTRLTQQLQGSVAAAVLTALHILGIAAVQNGNVIELPHVSVGVEEACSGIRSLVSCIFASVFISAVMVRGFWRRAAIILLAAPVAIGMNFCRSLLLTLLANEGVDISGAWHDITGFGVLLVTAGILAALALLFSHSKTRYAHRNTAEGPVEEPVDSERFRRPLGIDVLLFSGMAIACCALAFFAANTRSTSRATSSPPDLTAVLPSQAPGWEVSTRTDLHRFSEQLQTEILLERSYQRMDEKGVFQITAYLAYWRPGQAPVSLVASHTPEACWPGSGWEERQQAHRRVQLAAAGTILPVGEYRHFEYEDFPQHVWYWHLHDGEPVTHGGIRSPGQLLSLAWNYGFKDHGEQVFVRISSNREWTALAGEPLVGELVDRLQAMGLRPARRQADAR